MVRILPAVTIFVTCTALLVGAQSGEFIDTTVDQVPFTVEHSARLIAAAAGITSFGDAKDLSLEDVAALGYRVPKSPPDQSVTKGRFALLLMQCFDHRGGLRYELFATSTTAFRELQNKGMFAAWELPGEPLGGAEALDIVRFALKLDRSLER